VTFEIKNCPDVSDFLSICANPARQPSGDTPLRNAGDEPLISRGWQTASLGHSTFLHWVQIICSETSQAQSQLRSMIGTMIPLRRIGHLQAPHADMPSIEVA
jgi:hypothetical protein